MTLTTHIISQSQRSKRAWKVGSRNRSASLAPKHLKIDWLKVEVEEREDGRWTARLKHIEAVCPR